MRTFPARDGDRDLINRLRQVGGQTRAVSSEQSRAMARLAVAQGCQTSKRAHRWSRRAIAVGLSTAVGVGGVGVAVAAVMTNLDRTAQQTGVREIRPPNAGRTWTPVQVPYISVQPLMQYVGVDTPVVPTAAITHRNGRFVVYALAAIPSDQAAGHGSVKIRAIPVTPAQTVGRATVVTAGLSPCDVIVADPPRTLATGDAVQTYIAGDDNSPAINYQTLFGGRPAAPLPRIEGGIAHPAGMNSVAVNIVDERPTSGGAYYLYTAPDGFQQRVRYSRSQDFVVNLAHLRYGAPIGSIKVVSSGGRVLTTGHLDWYCSA